MSDLDPAHVEEVARAIDPIPFSKEATHDKWEHYRGLARSHATDLLTSTDPDVHAALLAALVRADYLPRARELADVAADLATASGCSPQAALETMICALTAVVGHAHD